MRQNKKMHPDLILAMQLRRRSDALAAMVDDEVNAVGEDLLAVLCAAMATMGLIGLIVFCL
jgi:hypothetical protein